MIVSNALTMGLQIDKVTIFVEWEIVEFVFNGLFVLEFLMRMHWSGYSCRFFRSAWTIFDFIVISVSVVDTVILGKVVRSDGRLFVGCRGGCSPPPPHPPNLGLWEFSWTSLSSAGSKAPCLVPPRAARSRRL